MRLLSARFRLPALLALAFSAILAVPVAAAETEVIRFTDSFAIAGFRSTDPTGCIRTTVLLTAGDDVDQEAPGAPTTSSGASLRITRFDSCTSTVITGSGFVSDVEFDSNPSAMEATLTATIPVTFTGPEGTFVEDVAVDMTWTAAGDVDREFNPNHFVFDGFILNAQFRLVTREAVATGTVLLDGENLTPAPSVSAEIAFEAGSQVTITT